jgi:hypothetical protein
VEVIRIIASPTKLPVAGPSTVESLYAEWVAELRNGIVGIHINPDESKTFLGPGFSDEQRITTLASGKRLADYRPRIDMVNFCIRQYNTGDPVAGLVGHVLKAAYPEQLAGMKYPEILEEAKRLAEAEAEGL